MVLIKIISYLLDFKNKLKANNIWKKLLVFSLFLIGSLIMLSATTTLNLNLLPNAMDQGYVYFLIN